MAMQRRAQLTAVLLLLCAWSPASVWAFPPDDVIVSLPGLATPASFVQYSGYLTASPTKRLHYWFVQSSNSPSTDPIAIWLNGGPGCSSLFGLLGENGPFRVNDDGATLSVNPFSWNTVANVLYIESPAGVGFSYATDKNYTTSDDESAQENYAAVKDFYDKFPEYVNNQLFVTGESYGGIYVPMLANLLMDDPNFNLQGYAIGNGVSSQEMLGDALMYFAYYHGLVGAAEWTDLIKQCCDGSETNCKFVTAARMSAKCLAEAKKVYEVIDGGYFDRYNLYNPCSGGVAAQRSAHHSLLQWVLPFTQKSVRGTASQGCNNNTALTTYLNSTAVRLALNIPSSVQPWENCRNLPYTQIYKDTSPFYQRLFNGGIRGILYNGDVDMVCNFLGDEWFADSLARPLKEGRKAWFYTDDKGQRQVAGFVKTFDLLTYLTVRGSGHMVPMDKPRPALVIFTNLVLNKPF